MTTDTLREAVARYQEEARVVYDRHHDFSNERGPSEGGRIGVAYGSEIFWVGSYCFPGVVIALIAFALGAAAWEWWF